MLIGGRDVTLLDELMADLMASGKVDATNDVVDADHRVLVVVDPTDRLFGAGDAQHMLHELDALSSHAFNRLKTAPIAFVDVSHATDLAEIGERMFAGLQSVLAAQSDDLQRFFAFSQPRLRVSLFELQQFAASHKKAFGACVFVVMGLEQTLNRPWALRCISDFVRASSAALGIVVTRKLRLPSFRNLVVRKVSFEEFTRGGSRPRPNPAVAKSFGFWGKLSSRLRQFLDYEDVQRANVDGMNGKSESDEVFLAKLSGFVYQACYPSHALQRRVYSALNHYTDLALDAAAKEMARVENERRDSDSFMSSKDLAESLPPAVFLKVLEIAFPSLIHAARTRDEGIYRLYLLLSHFSGRLLGPEEAVALESSPWCKFRANENLRGCCRSALVSLQEREAPLVTPFASPRALRQHMDGLLNPDPESSAAQWARELERLDEIVEQEVGDRVRRSWELDDERALARDEQTKEMKALVATAGHVGKAELSTDEIRGVVERYVAATNHLVRVEKELQEMRNADFPEPLIEWLTDALRRLRPNSTVVEAEDLNELGQNLVAVLEIACAGEPAFFAELGLDLGEKLKECADIFRKAIERSRGAVAFEAFLGLARACVLGARHYDGLTDASNKNDLSSALDIDAARALQFARQIAAPFPERRMTVELVDILLLERSRAWAEAEKHYWRIFELASDAGYTEVAARAGFSAARVLTAQRTKASRRSLLWAQSTIRLQQARSPFFNRTRKSAFVSYRRETQKWVRAFCEALKGRDFDLEVWVDYESIVEANDDYRAEMQLGLDRATHTILVFSPGYFESRWCSYELTTAISRKRLNNQKIGWLCIDNRPMELIGDVSDPRAYVRGLAARPAVSAEDVRFFDSQLSIVLGETMLSEKVIRAGASGYGVDVDPADIVREANLVASNWARSG
jgi:hypothetical protein